MNFNEIHDRYKTRVSAMIRGTHLPVSDQQSIEQDVFIRVSALMTNGKFPEDKPNQEAAVIRLVMEFVSKHRRTLGRVAKNNPIPASNIHGLNLNRVVWDDERDDTWEVLEDLLPCLPEKYREVVDMRLQEMSFADIGKALYISENLANVRYFRAIEKLREANKRRLQAA